MMEDLAGVLVRYPELTVFLVVGIGSWLGTLSLGGFQLGPVTGSLFAGIAVGQLADVPVSPMAKSFLFLLFLFGIGFSVGPQFVPALRAGGFKPVLLAVVTCTVGLGMAMLVSRLLGLDAGFAAGLVSGALTQSPAMGTATEAINALAIPPDQRQTLIAHIAVGDAVCYIFGSIGAILFLSEVAPRLLRLDLGVESRKLEDKLGIARASPGVVSAWRPYELRAYRLESGSALVGLTLADCEARAGGERLFAQRLRRGGALLDALPDEVLQAGDIVAVAGKRDALVSLLGTAHSEVEDAGLLDIPVAVSDVLVTSKEISGHTLAEFAALDWTRNLYARSVTRGTESIPVGPGTQVLLGDVVRLIGPEDTLEQAAGRIGPVIRPTAATDLVVMAIAIFLGGLAGALIAVPLGPVTITLGSSVGTLLAGLLVGHLQTRHPLFGRIPQGAVTLMTQLGLAAFVAMTGLHAGPVFFLAVREAGIGLLLGGALVTLVPLVVGLLFGFYVLRMNPILLLGGLAGAQTITAAMAAVQTRARSPVAVLGYTPTVPLGHILLTTWGTLIVRFVAG